MKKLIVILSIATINSSWAIPVEVIADVPAQAKEIQSKIDVTTTLQTMINAVSQAQTTAGQVQALQNLQNLQNNPGTSLSQINSAVSGLLSNFNTLNNSSYSSLGQLIGSLAGSASTEAMNVKLMQASNMQLSGIQNTLTALQAQNQALIAYKQNEANEKLREQAATQQTIQNQANSLGGL